MADPKAMENGIDPRIAKDMEKDRKKLEKQKKKQQKAINSYDNDEQETTGGKIIIAVVSIAIVLVWLAIFALLIKWDIGGFGSSVLYPLLKDVPYINKILPEVIEEDDPYAFDDLSEAIARIKELELIINQLQSDSGVTDETILALQAEVSRLKIYEQQQQEFEKNKTNFYNEVVFGDEAPDIEVYKEYYEAIDPEGAAEIYKQVITQIEIDEEIQEYVKAYSTMDPDDAAAIMEEMTDQLDLVAKILWNMNAEARGEILAAMDSSIAADLTKLMEP